MDLEKRCGSVRRSVLIKLTNDREQFFHSVSLDKTRLRTRFQGLWIREFRKAENQNTGLGELSGDRFRRRQSIHYGHACVHKQYVGTVLPLGDNRLFPGSRFCGDLHIRLVSQKRCQAVSHTGMIVYDKNTNTRVSYHVPPFPRRTSFPLMDFNPPDELYLSLEMEVCNSSL